MITQLPDESKIPNIPNKYQKAVDFYMDVIYDDRGDGRGKLDLYRPANVTGVTPCLIYIHGGGFVSGDKSAIIRSAFNDLLKKCIMSGISIISINYTLTNKLSDSQGIGRAIDSIGEALKEIKLSTDILQIDPDNIGYWGSSAGGYAAMWYSMKEFGTIENPIKGKFAISFKPNATMNLFKIEELGLLGPDVTLNSVLQDAELAEACVPWFGLNAIPQSVTDLQPGLGIMEKYDPYFQEMFTSTASPFYCVIDAPDELPAEKVEYVHNPANGAALEKAYREAGATAYVWGTNNINPVDSLPPTGRPGLVEWMLGQFNI